MIFEKYRGLDLCAGFYKAECTAINHQCQIIILKLKLEDRLSEFWQNKRNIIMWHSQSVNHLIMIILITFLKPCHSSPYFTERTLYFIKISLFLFFIIIFLYSALFQPYLSLNVETFRYFQCAFYDLDELICQFEKKSLVIDESKPWEMKLL